MSGLFKKPAPIPDPEPPARMPDPQDAMAESTKRRAERRIRGQSSTQQNRLAPVAGTIGREYSRATLGAG